MDDTNLRQQIMFLIQKERIYQNLSQYDLANRTGLSQSAISRFEKGQALPSLTTLYKIAKALDKNLQIKFI